MLCSFSIFAMFGSKGGIGGLDPIWVLQYFHIYVGCDLFHIIWGFEKALLTLHVVTEMHFLLQKNLKNIMHGRVKMYVMR